MFESKDVKLFAGPSACASLRGRRLRWTCSLDGGRWSKDTFLPEGVTAGAVAAVFPDGMGMTLITGAGEMHFWDAQRDGWDARGTVLADGAA